MTKQEQLTGALDHLVATPAHLRKGILSAEQIEEVGRQAAAKREAQTQARNCSPDALGRQWGVSRELVLFIQRLEARVIDLEREVAQLRQTDSMLPAHMRNVERRS